MSLRNQLIRLAHTNPALRSHILPIIRMADEQSKVAGKDTFDFVLWAFLQDPVPSSRVFDFLERHGVEYVEPAEPGTSNRGKPIGVGELVQPQASNAPGDLLSLLKPYDLQKGTVVKVEGDDIVIKFQGSGDLLRVPGGVNAGKKSGIYRTTQFDSDSGGGGKSWAHIEIVYEPADDRAPSAVAIQRVREYVEKGLSQSEARSPNYFTGYVPSYTKNKAGEHYMRLFSQQRGGDMRSFNPSKGKVHYIGIVGQRPGNWLHELESEQTAQGIATAG